MWFRNMHEGTINTRDCLGASHVFFCVLVAILVTSLVLIEGGPLTIQKCYHVYNVAGKLNSNPVCPLDSGVITLYCTCCLLVFCSYSHGHAKHGHIISEVK